MEIPTSCRWMLVLLLLSGCSEDEDAAPFEPQRSTRQTIGPEGGRISFDRATLTVPANALERETEIEINRVDMPAPARWRAHSPFYRFQPTGLQLLSPATIEFELAELPPPFARIVWCSGEDCEAIAPKVAGNLLVGPISHFSVGFVGSAANIDGGGVVQIDGGVPIDGGVVPIDGGVVPIDGGTIFTDGGAVFIDGGVRFVDGGAAHIDGGVAFIDGGVISTDSGTVDVGVDGGSQPVDSGALDSGEADSGILDASSDGGSSSGCSSTWITEDLAPSTCQYNPYPHLGPVTVAFALDGAGKAHLIQDGVYYTDAPGFWVTETSTAIARSADRSLVVDAMGAVHSCGMVADQAQHEVYLVHISNESGVWTAIPSAVVPYQFVGGVGGWIYGVYDCQIRIAPDGSLHVVGRVFGHSMGSGFGVHLHGRIVNGVWNTPSVVDWGVNHTEFSFDSQGHIHRLADCSWGIYCPLPSSSFRYYTNQTGTWSSMALLPSPEMGEGTGALAIGPGDTVSAILSYMDDSPVMENLKLATRIGSTWTYTNILSINPGIWSNLEIVGPKHVFIGGTELMVYDGNLARISAPSGGCNRIAVRANEVHLASNSRGRLMYAKRCLP